MSGGKPIGNSKISYPNIYGRIIQYEEYLNQPLTSTSSPTFANLNITNDLTVNGTLYVLGNASILDTNLFKTKDNIILINDQEVGAGVTLNQAGIEVDRGSLENYRIVYQETTNTTIIGPISNMQAIATREDTPLIDGVMVWDDTNKRLNSTDTIQIPLTLTSTSATSLHSLGGAVLDTTLSVKNSITLGTSASTSVISNTGSSLIISTPTTLDLQTPIIKVQSDSPIYFGNSSQSLLVNSTTKNFIFTTPGNVQFVLPTNSSIILPQTTHIQLSTTNDYLGTDQFNNVNLNATNDIYLTPNAGQNIIIPTNIPIVLGTNTQQISSQPNGDVSILANNNININPGTGLDIRIPTNNGIKFGGSGTQRIYADTSSNLIIEASNSILLDTGTPIVFGTDSSISGTNSQLTITGNVQFTSTQDAAQETLGSLYTFGGINAFKTILSQKSIQVTSTNSSALIIGNDSTPDTLKVSSFSNGSVLINAGNSTTSSPSLLISSNNPTSADNLLQLTSIQDTTNGYSLGRSDRKLKINIPDYASYSSASTIPTFSFNSISQTDTSIELLSINSDGITTFTNSINATSETSASVIIQGSVGIKKDTYSTGRFIQQTDSTSAILFQDASYSPLVILDSINKNLQIPANLTITNTQDAISTSSAAILTQGGQVIQKQLRVLGATTFYSALSMQNNRITNVTDPLNPQDVATRNYVDLYAQGISVKLSADVATTTQQSLSIDFFEGSLIDSYTLQLYDRILLKNQLDPIENGIYVVQGPSTQPTRSSDFNTGYSASGAFVFIKSGTLNKDSGYICSSASGSDVVGTDSIIFAQFTGAGSIVAGNALTKTFNQLDVNVDDSSIEISSNNLRVKSSIAGTGLTGGSGSPLSILASQPQITQVGTITLGAWQSNSQVQVLYGGTGNIRFTSGSILIGAGTAPLLTTSKLFFDSSAGNFGIGTNNPVHALHVSSTSVANILIQSDTDEVNPNVSSSLILKHGSSVQSTIQIVRNDNELATGSISDSLVINSTNSVQLASQQIVRLTISSSGSVGINNTAPSTTLDITGSLHSSGLITFTNTTNQTAVSISGGLSVQKDSIYNGLLTLQNTTQASSPTSGSLILSRGGVLIQSTSDSTSMSDGGSLLSLGGATFQKSVIIGGNETINGTLQILDSSNVISSTSASIITYGGASIQQDLLLGGQLTLPTQINFTSSNILNTLGSLLLHDNTLALNTSSINLNEDTTITTTTQASGTTSGSLVTMGGANIRGNAIMNKTLVINDTTQATNETSAALVSFGGISTPDSVYIGTDLTTISKMRNANNALYTKVENTSTSASLWTYLGSISNCKITLENLEFQLNIQNTTVSASHSFTTSPQPESNIIVYQGLSSDFYLYALISPNVSQSLAIHSSNTIPSLISEGLSTNPDGTSSGFTTGWTIVYSTTSESTETFNIGPLISADLHTKTPFPLINSDYTSTNTPIGVVSQLTTTESTLYPPSFSDTLPNQSSSSLYQTILSTSGSATVNFYSDWFIKATSGLANNQVRKIISYDETQQILTLDTPWTTQGPIQGDTVELFNKTMTSLYYSAGSLISSYVTFPNNTLLQQELLDFKTNNITSESLSISSTQDATSTSASFLSQGGITIKKSIYTTTGLGIGTNMTFPKAIDTHIHIHDDSPLIKLQATQGSSSLINFTNDDNSNTFGINSSDLLEILSNTTSSITITSSGNVGINTTSNINSPLTIKSSIITTNSNTEFLGISGGDGPTSGSSLTLFGNNATGSAGNAIISATNAYFSNGPTYFQNTLQSSTSSTGSVVVSGGFGINSTANATSFTTGGCATFRGGASFFKDVYINGSLILGGIISIPGVNSTPSITFQNTSNCSIAGYGNNELVRMGSENMLSFYVTVIPSTAHTNTQFEFVIPSVTSNLANRTDIIVSISGYTDDTNLISLSNILSTGVVGTTNAIVKFQSVSTASHTLQLIVRYTPN